MHCILAKCVILANIKLLPQESKWHLLVVKPEVYTPAQPRPHPASVPLCWGAGSAPPRWRGAPARWRPNSPGPRCPPAGSGCGTSWARRRQSPSRWSRSCPLSPERSVRRHSVKERTAEPVEEPLQNPCVIQTEFLQSPHRTLKEPSQNHNRTHRICTEPLPNNFRSLTEPLQNVYRTLTEPLHSKVPQLLPSFLQKTDIFPPILLSHDVQSMDS